MCDRYRIHARRRDRQKDKRHSVVVIAQRDRPVEQAEQERVVDGMKLDAVTPSSEWTVVATFRDDPASATIPAAPSGREASEVVAEETKTTPSAWGSRSPPPEDRHAKRTGPRRCPIVR